MPTRQVALTVPLAIVCLALPTFAQRSKTVTEGPIVIKEFKHDTGPLLREIAPLLPEFGTPSEREVPNNANPSHPWSNNKVEKDAVLQTAENSRTLQTPNPNVEFDGIGYGDNFFCNCVPPDNDGAPGTTQYVQYINLTYQVFDKKGNSVLGPLSGNDFWSGFGGSCASDNSGDPIVRFDAAAKRWVVAQLAVNGSAPDYECVAVSQTDDATGAYYRYAFPFNYFPDYPKLGIWPDAYYFTFNNFPVDLTGPYVGANVCAADRSKMLVGDAATMQCFQQDSSQFGMLPSDLDGPTPPAAGTPNFVMELDPDGSANLDMFAFHVDFSDPNNSTFTGPTLIPVAAFTPLCVDAGGHQDCVPQPTEGSDTLEALSDRLMYRLVYRNFGDHTTLLTSHSVVAGSSGGVRWYEIHDPETSPTMFQSGTWAPDSQWRWMPSIAMDQNQDIAVGYSWSGSGAGQYPSVNYAGRVASDPLGTLESEVVMAAGSESQFTGSNRWGDYTSMTVDPTDDCTFWFSEEYLHLTGQQEGFDWSTAIGSFVFPDCPGTSNFSLTQPSPVTITQGTSVMSTIIINPLNGFSGNVTFSASGLPNGVTASFDPNPATTTSTLTLTASATAATGTVTVTVTGTSGTLTNTTTFSLTVNTPENFSLAAAPSSVSITQGSSGTSTITITPVNGFTGNVTLSASGLPNGVTAAFNPNPATTTSTLTFTASATATTGTVTVTITGMSGSLSQTTTLSLTVNGSPNFSLAAAPSSVSITQGSSGASTITITPVNGFAGNVTLSASGLPNGVTAAFNPNPATTTSALTLTASATAALGTVTVTITGMSGSLSQTTTLSLTVNGSPNFSLAAAPSSVSITQGSSGTSTITITPVNGFTGNVTLSASGLPNGVTAAFNPNPATTTSTLTFTASATATTGTVTVTITGMSGSLSQTTTLSLTVNGSPNFSLAAAPSSVSITQGSSGASTITITPVNGFAGNVTLSASGLPNGVTAAFNPNPATTTSALTLTASATAALGTVTVTITGMSGSLSQTTTLSLTVNGSPNFSLAAAPSSVSITQGSSGTSTITIAPVNGFTGNVTLSASGLPNGVTAAFNPNPATTTSTLTLTASGTAATGTVTVTITGMSGSLSQTTTLSLTVNGSPNFSLAAAPSSVSITQGSSGASTITITPVNGFTGNVTLSASGLPNGVTAAFNPNPATTTSTLTLTASGTAATGTVTVTITGVSGSLSQTTTLSLTVNGSPNFSLAAAPSSVSITQGSSGTSTITITPVNGFTGNVTLSASGLPNGVTAAFNPNPATTTSTLTFTASATATTGTVTVTITGLSGSLSQTTTLSLTVNGSPNFSLAAAPSSVTITQGSSGTSTITITPVNGFTGNVTLSASGLPNGVTAAFSPNPATSSSVLTLTASDAAPTGTTTVAITGTSGTLSATTTITLTVSPLGNFKLTASPKTLTVFLGSGGTSTITITSQSSFSSATTLSAAGLPSGVTATFSADPVTPPANGAATSVLTLTASATATTGTAKITVTGSSGPLTHSATIALSVKSGAQTALYNSTLGAPECGNVGTSCDSGPSLLLGRDQMSGGAEPNQPNTINNSCADGTSGTFHASESNDRIVVTSGSGILTRGTTATVTATVWAWSTEDDSLDLYYAANANKPSWVFIETLKPTNTGAQSLSATFTLPPGKLQAVRAQFRYLGSASSCTTGPFNDHDDLIFAVQ